MAREQRAKVGGHEIAVIAHDDNTATVFVDGEEVPVRVVDGRYAVAYIEPQDDLLEGARQYARLLPPRRG